MSRPSRWLLGALLTAFVLPTATATATAAPPAPGAPGAKPVWTSADKQGFGTSFTRSSPVWFTLGRGRMTEAYYPDLGTPALRQLDLVVSDGRTFAERASTATRHRVEVVGGARTLTYRQVDTARSGRYRITRTYVTDPARATVLVDVRFQSLTGRKYAVYVLSDPALSNDGADDRGRTVAGGRVLAWDRRAAVALQGRPALAEGTSGYLGRSDGLRELRAVRRLVHRYDAPRPGNVVQVARTGLSGVGGATRTTLSLGFGRTRRAALRTAGRSLRASFATTAGAYARGWDGYLRGLSAPPASVGALRSEYDLSLLVLRASEDKRHPGASIASPSMPWDWGNGKVEKGPSAPYHLVWSRDLYQVATAQLAAGDRASATRELDFLLFRQQKPDGSLPQNSEVSGKEHWTNTQNDEIALPIVLAWQLGRTDAHTYAHVRRAADYLLKHGPKTKQERWENQEGWSPGTIAAEVAGLVCAAELATANGDPGAAARWRSVADAWAAGVQGWTATTNGPYAPRPYYLRLTKDRRPNRATKYDIGDSGPKAADQRRVVDPSFLELVRLGVKRPDDPAILNTVGVVDRILGVTTPNGTFWHRFTFDGYGETSSGGPWGLGKPNTFRTHGRAWPLFAGERGEYELAAGRPAEAQLRAMGAAANGGGLISEQVWDRRAPAGRPGFPSGEGTFSATPLAWSHAQLVRLAWSIQAGRPVERPAVVACRYSRIDC
jgi:glucoamylase